MNDLTLVIDDNPDFNAVLVRALERRGFAALGALGSEQALKIAGDASPTRVVLDLNLDGSSGLALIPPLMAINPECRIVVLTGYASIATAVDAIKLGARQYLAKPADIEAILAAFESLAVPEIDQTAPSQPLTVDRLEWEHIQRVLKEHEGNISSTARALKMHRRTLQRKLAKRPARS